MNSWDYVIGTVLKGYEQLWRATGDTSYKHYVQVSVDPAISAAGKISSGYSFTSLTLDNINEGRMVLLLYQQTGASKYKIAADTLRKQLSVQPRTPEGGFWHKLTYPNQMWLDGLYMAEPFYAEYGKMFGETGDYDSVALQLTLMETHARDGVTGLLYHGWDASKAQAWANPVTGCSPSFWGRAIGWYAMSLVDVLDYLPADHPQRGNVIAILERLATALGECQDPATGTWYQVLDQGSRSGNYHESSASCAFVYALAKGVRLGYLPSTSWEVVKKGYAGVLNTFISMNTDSTINIDSVCSSAGLGGSPYRDGTFAYYTNQESSAPTPIVRNDGKGVGPFIMASVELEGSGFVLPPQRFRATGNIDTTVTLQWTDKTYNAQTFRIERKSSQETAFGEIGSVPKGVTAYVDGTVAPGTTYWYRARAKSDTAYSDYTSIDSVTTPGVQSVRANGTLANAFSLRQNYPNPFNPSTTIRFTLADRGSVLLTVVDVLGRTVATLVNTSMTAGSHEVLFDATRFSSGVYFCRLQSGSSVAVRRLLLVR